MPLTLKSADCGLRPRQHFSNTRSSPPVATSRDPSHLEPNNDRTLYIFMLLAFTAGFAFFLYIFIRPFFRGAAVNDFLYVLPFLVFIFVWYIILLRLIVWRAFGVEQIVVEGGLLRWTRTALIWKRKLEVSVTDVTDVRPITPWHGLSNHVEFRAQGRSRSLGDMLLRDDATEPAQKLSHTVRVGR